jgi:hypothetical protein
LKQQKKSENKPQDKEVGLGGISETQVKRMLGRVGLKAKQLWDGLYKRRGSTG